MGAIGREFPFPLNTQTRPTFVNGFEGANVANYHNAIHPLIANQRELLRILNEERRQRQRDLKNDSLSSSENKSNPMQTEALRERLFSNLGAPTKSWNPPILAATGSKNSHSLTDLAAQADE